MANLFGCASGLEQLFDEYLNSSDSEGDKDSGSEDALVGGNSDNGDSDCTTRTSSDIQVRALEDMMSGETACFVHSEPMDGLEDFLHTSMLDYPAFGDPLATSSSSSWKPTHADSAGTWQPAGHDQYQGSILSLKYDPSLAPGPVKTPVPAQDAAPFDFSAGAIPSAGGRSLDELRERELDRRARVERYRQKRRERAFVKKIRYEARNEEAVRKINAEQRPRYKGRFIKQEELAAMKQRDGSA